MGLAQRHISACGFSSWQLYLSAFGRPAAADRGIQVGAEGAATSIASFVQEPRMSHRSKGNLG